MYVLAQMILYMYYYFLVSCVSLGAAYLVVDDLMSLLDTAAPGDHSAAVLMDAEALVPDDIITYPIRTRVTGRQSQAGTGNSPTQPYLRHTSYFKIGTAVD